MCKLHIVKAPADGSCFFHCIELALGIQRGLRYLLAKKVLSIPKYRKHYAILNSSKSVDYELFEPVSEILNINILILVEEDKQKILYPFVTYYSKDFIENMKSRKTIVLKYVNYGHYDLVTLKHGKMIESNFPFTHPFIKAILDTQQQNDLKIE